MTRVLSVAPPSGWRLSPLKHVTTLINRGSAPDYTDDGEVRVVGQPANQPVGLDWGRTRFHRLDGDFQRVKGCLLPGDIVVNSTGTGTLGRVGYFTESPDGRVCMADGHITVIRTDRSAVDSRFAYYWLNSRQFQEYLYAALTVGATNQIELDRDGLKDSEVPVPPMAEQRRIAEFLDTETRNIDRLVALRRKQAALARSRFENFLVKSLLHPGKTDDWVRTRLKYLFQFERGGIWGSEPSGLAHDVACVRVADFRRNVFKAGENAVTMRSVPRSQLAKRLLRHGDVLLEKSGGGELSPVGFAVSYDGRARSVCSNFISLLRPRPDHDSRFTLFILAAIYAAKLNLPHVKQTTGIQNLDINGFLGQSVSVPTVKTQRELARELDSRNSSCESLVASSERQVGLLAERRQELITAAVTGQINVTTAQGAPVP